MSMFAVAAARSGAETLRTAEPESKVHKTAIVYELLLPTASGVR
jgi:hypothetical protein